MLTSRTKQTPRCMLSFPPPEAVVELHEQQARVLASNCKAVQNYACYRARIPNLAARHTSD